MRGGYIYSKVDNTLTDAGRAGLCYSNTTRTERYPYYLSFSNISTPNNGSSGSRANGISLRCVGLTKQPIPIPKIKVLSIAHYTSSVEATSSIALWTSQVTMAAIGLAPCSPIPTPVTCISLVVVPIRRISTTGSTDFLSAG